MCGRWYHRRLDINSLELNIAKCYLGKLIQCRYIAVLVEISSESFASGARD
jgi:hypothetical protein